MIRRETIRTIIEQEREELNRLAAQYGLLDKRVLEQSIELDELINKYNKVRYYDSQKKKPIA
ncbi:aspartyl-phosphate phosphatase Spo0E family protein [Paenibacillus motobuensis]|uniref:Aspartyl-phosphate phosphatase Spo0E family protein n=1 Tax=Paenibacillus motobuensis TaxID=295324 RepID=A0ABN0YR47_9BACL